MQKHNIWTVGNFIYIYIYVCVCVCVCVLDEVQVHTIVLSQRWYNSSSPKPSQEIHRKTLATNSSQLGITSNQCWSLHQIISTCQHSPLASLPQDLFQVFYFSQSCMRLKIGLGDIVHVIIFQFTILNINMEYQFLYYHFL